MENETLKSVLSEHGYVLLRPLGNGGFSTVFLIQSTQYQEYFVAKIVDLGKKSAFPQVYEQEIHSLSHLMHPNIIQIFNFFRTEKHLIMILEYCNESLAKTIATHGHIHPPLVYHYCRQLVDALDYCHSLNIAHHDIKPSNVLLDQHGRLKLADFGLAQYLSESGISRCYYGSRAYMAPEVLAKEPYDAKKADIWSLGITFFEMIVGRLPWMSLEGFTLEEEIADGYIIVPNRVPQQFSDLILQMTEMDPCKRIDLADIRSHPAFSQTMSITVLPSLYPNVVAPEPQSRNHSIKAVNSMSSFFKDQGLSSLARTRRKSKRNIYQPSSSLLNLSKLITEDM